MQNPARVRVQSTRARSERVAILHAEQARALERRVSRRASVSAPQTIEDACAFAWLQLLTRPHLALARGPALLGWLEQTATREAWRIEARRARDGPHGDIALERGAPTVPGADELAAQRARIGLVEQLPERPRRFLLRLALGHSYREIAASRRARQPHDDEQADRTRQAAAGRRRRRRAESTIAGKPRPP